MPPSPPASLRFGPDGRFELQPAAQRLLVDGVVAELGGRAFDLLQVFAARPGHLLSKAELLDSVWPGLVVEEANLQMQVSNLRKLLGGDAIATVPGRGYRFVAEMAGVGRATPSQLPPLSQAQQQPVPIARSAGPRLIGRAGDLAQLQRRLKQARCVTLLGPSGVGKTSLARAAAAAWPGRSVWLDLATLPPNAEVLPTLARVFELPVHDGPAVLPALSRLLQGSDTPVLLVLDNAEHVVDACATLAAPLLALPQLTLLATSQQPLAVADEVRQAVDPLPQPADDHDGTGLGHGDDALALLLERIAAVDHRFAVTAVTAGTLAASSTLPLLRAICRQLDGLPLALEMAAARVPMLGVQGVHDALAERFALLTRGHRDAAPRHRTLREALDWSHRLLAVPEQLLFRRLGLFVGSFPLDLALAVAADLGERWDLVDRLSALVEHSLVVVDAAEPPRYRLLETVRAFAAAELQAVPDEAVAARRRLGQALLQCFEGTAPGDMVAVGQRVLEMDHVRETLVRAQAHGDQVLAIELAIAVCAHLTFTTWRHEARRWLLAQRPWLDAVSDDAAAALPLELQARWWEAAARQLAMQRAPDAHATAQRALALARRLGDNRRVLWCAIHAVRSLAEPGAALDQACADLNAALAARSGATARERAVVAGSLGVACELRGDRAGALAAYQDEAQAAQGEPASPMLLETARAKVVAAMQELGHHADAAEQGLALLAASADDSPNRPWVGAATVLALFELGRFDELATIALGIWDSSVRFGAPACRVTLAAWLLHASGAQAAVEMLGHTQQTLQSLDATLHPDTQAAADAMLVQVQAEHGAAATQGWLASGRRLGDAAARALVAAAVGSRTATR